MPRQATPLTARQRLLALAKLHVEKLAFGLSAVVLIALLWSTFSSDVYSFTPEQLAAGAREAKAVLDRDSDWKPDPGPGGFQARPMDRYRYDHPWFHNPMDQTVKLRDLELLPLENLQVSFGRAPFRAPRKVAAEAPVRAERQVAAPPGPPRPLPELLAPDAPAAPDRPRPTETTIGRRYAILTGLIPWASQKRIFDELPLFKRLPVAQNDLEYAGFVIERAEVRDGKVDAFQTLDLNLLNQEIDSWPSEQPELADEEHLLEGMAVPLGPRVKPWTAAEVLAPGVPERQPGKAQVQPHPRPRGRVPMGLIKRPVHPRPLPEAPVAQDPQPQRLFRAFDFTVEPGKQYCYRVRLAVQNPNYGVHPGYLASAELAKNLYELTPPSQVSQLVEIPLDWRLLAGPITPATNVYPAEARVGVEIWDVETGADAAGVLRLKLGDVLDGRCTIRYRDPIFLAPPVGAAGLAGQAPRAVPFAPPLREKHYDFAPGMVLVDAIPGDPLSREWQTLGSSRKLHSGRLLLLDSQGQTSSLRFTSSNLRIRQIEADLAAPLEE